MPSSDKDKSSSEGSGKSRKWILWLLLIAVVLLLLYLTTNQIIDQYDKSGDWLSGGCDSGYGSWSGSS